ncbi:MAG: hypothetical protein GX943_00115 [Candidatus Pacebacteria bacterium]|nr:hypothetical protein [Candidatus Paceibacterota bacterium]
MSDLNTTQKATTVRSQTSQQPIQKTMGNTEGPVSKEAPQKVFRKKKTIIRFKQVIWYILGLIEVLLVFRVILKVLGASQASAFTNFIYSITAALVLPFNGILKAFALGDSILEWSTIIAGLVYLSLAWGFIYLLELIYPISPDDVETH